MVRIANLINTIGRSGMHLGPLDAVFAGMDYAGGKSEGEDDIRAAAGAAGSTAGGLGGALAGAAVGQALIPIPGVGAGIGAIAGGMGGGFLGGWGADRADGAIRGNQGASLDERRQSNYQGEEDNTLRNSIAGAAAVGAGAYGLKKLGDKTMMGGYNPVKAGAYNAGQSVRQGFETAVDAAGNVIRRVPGPLKAIGAAGLAIGAGMAANNAMGNPIGGAIDMATGDATNFRPNDPGYVQGMNTPADMRRRQMNQEAADFANQQYALQRQREQDETGFANKRDYMDYQNQKAIETEDRRYNRKFEYDDYFGRMDIDAKQAANLLDTYNKGMVDATNAMGNILNTRYF